MILYQESEKNKAQITFHRTVKNYNYKSYRIQHCNKFIEKFECLSMHIFVYSSKHYIITNA